jgi:hypothetical protein
MLPFIDAVVINLTTISNNPPAFFTLMTFKHFHGFGFQFILLTFVLSICVIGQTGIAATLKFNLIPGFQTGLNTVQTRYADLDGDGFIDIIAVSGSHTNPNPGLNILFGSADGSFSAFVSLPSTISGQTVAAGDLNNDGKKDLVIASWYQNALAVFINQGGRQFAAPVFSIPPDPPNPGFPYGEFFDLAIADFDGDGNNDVAALQDQIDQRLRFFHFNADSTLTVFTTLNQIGSNTSYEREMSVGDINGDNRPDVVLAGGGPFGVRHVSFVFGQPPGNNLSMVYGFGVEDKAVGININDMDNDGDQDLVFAFLDTSTPTRHSLQIFRNNGNGSFIFEPKIFLEYPFPPDDITTGDYNNDGIQDIAALIGSVYNSGVMVRVSYGRSDGNYTGETYYAVSNSISIFSADVNNDNKTDLLVASSNGLNTDIIPYNGESNNGVSVLYNNNFQGFKAPLVTLWGPNIIDAGDFNEDGYSDLVSSWATEFNATSGVDILINDRMGGLLPEVHYPSPVTGLAGMRTGDFNGDGKWDAVSRHSQVLSVFLGNGNGTLAPPVLTPFNRGLSTMTIADFNNDGKDDVFVVDTTFQRDMAWGYAVLGTGSGVFTPAPGNSVELPGNVPYELQTGDFNGDQNEDVVITMNSNLMLLLGDGTGRFTRSTVTIPPLSRTTVGDFNGDGKLDLAGMTGPAVYSNFITGVPGNGQGGFGTAFSKQIPNFSFNTVQSLVTADFDLDGSEDVAMIMKDNTFGNLIIVQSNRESASWKQPIFYNLGTATRSLVAADFNNDGKPDLGYLGDNARGVIYNTTSRSTFNSIFDFDGDRKTDISIFRPSAGEWWYLRSSDAGNRAAQFGNLSDIPTPADFTGDGKTDIAFFRPSTGEWFMLRSEDDSYLSFPFGAAGDVPVVGDFDADGRADPTVYRPSTNEWFILKSTGGTVITTFGAEGDVPVLADYDGDGKTDIAIYRPSVGQWWIQGSSNGQTVAAAFGTSSDKPVPGDYSGDGKADIAFWRPATGEWFILRTEDASFYSVPFGATGDVPVPGDYDGDGKFDTAVFRPSSATWYINRTNSGLLITNFGANGDRPIPNAYVP